MEIPYNSYVEVNLAVLFSRTYAKDSGGDAAPFGICSVSSDRGEHIASRPSTSIVRIVKN